MEQPLLRYGGDAEGGDGARPPDWRLSVGAVARTLIAVIVVGAVVAAVFFTIFVVDFFYAGYQLRREGAAGFARPAASVRLLTPEQRAVEETAQRERNLRFEMAILLHPSQAVIERAVNRIYEARSDGDALPVVGHRLGPAGETLTVFAGPAGEPAIEIVARPGVERSSLNDVFAGRADLAIDLHRAFWADVRIASNAVDVAPPAIGSCIGVRSISVWRPGSPERTRVGAPAAGRLCLRREPAEADARWVHVR